MLVGDFTAFIKLGTADKLRLFKPSTTLPVSRSADFGTDRLCFVFISKSRLSKGKTICGCKRNKKKKKSWT